MKFLDNVVDLLYFPAPLPGCLSRFVQKIFTIKCQSRRKTKQPNLPPPFFPLPATPTVLQQIVIIRRLAKCGWVLFADLCLRSLAM